MPPIKTRKYGNEFGLYMLLSARVIEQMSMDIGISSSDSYNILWIHYINKYILKSSYINTRATEQFFNELYMKGKPPSVNAMLLLLQRLHDKGLINKQGRHYPLDYTFGQFIARYSRCFVQKAHEFELSTQDIKRTKIFSKARHLIKRRKYVRKKPRIYLRKMG